MRELKNQEMNQMLAMDVREPAQTKRTSVIVLDPKKDQTAQFTVNYLTLNAVTIPESYSILSLAECGK